MAKFCSKKEGTKTYPAHQYTRNRFGKSRRMVRLDRLERKFAQTLVDRIGTEGKIIDIPCGDGRFSSIFSQANLVASADYEPKMLQANQANHGNLVQGRLLIADIATLPFASNSVDLIFSMRLLHHVRESKTRVSILKELARVSRTWVAVSFYRKECLRYFRKRILRKEIPGCPIWTKSLDSEAAQCGLELVERIPWLFGVNSQTLALFRKSES